MSTTDRRRWSSKAPERMQLRGPFVVQQIVGSLATLYYEATQTHATTTVAMLDDWSEVIS